MTNYADFDLPGEQQGHFSFKNLLVYSHEDHFLGYACSDLFEREHDHFVGKSGERLDVLILRDPFNLFASRFRSGYGTVPLRTAVMMWKQHAKGFLGLTKRLKHRPVFVNYNRRVVDPAYRRHVAEALGFRFSDKGANQVPLCAGGSSFDGLRYNGRAHEMRVLERWEHYADEPWFAAVFDREMAELAERIFGAVPGTDSLFHRTAVGGVEQL